jgi:LysR family transcriptional activator of nhaA
VDDLNYHHLRYFWIVAREGSIAAACAKMHVAQPTISAQIRALERSIGARLFRRAGRGLVLTDTGRLAFRYAEDIFALGGELVDAVRGRPPESPLQVRVGVADVIPKLIVHRLLAPAFELPDPVRVTCFEGKPVELLARLSVHDLDVVLADTPIGPQVHVRAFNHPLGESDVTILGTKELADRFRRRFPASLDGAPFLLPTENSVVRQALDRWFETREIRPEIVAEFEDSALLKVFGQGGAGLFVVPTVVATRVRTQFRVRTVGRIEEVRERFYAISVERKVRNPAVQAIADAARSRLFA